jgi:hypothetical protein
MRTTLADYGAVLAKHGVTVDRPEPLPAEWLPLLDLALERLVGLGWQRRRLKQVKEKFGTLRVYVDQDGEVPLFLEQATEVLSAARDASEELPEQQESCRTGGNR